MTDPFLSSQSFPSKTQEFSKPTPRAAFAVTREQITWDHHPYGRSFHMKDEEPIVELPYLQPVNLPQSPSLYEDGDRASNSHMWDVTLGTAQKEEELSLKYRNHHLGMLR